MLSVSTKALGLRCAPLWLGLDFNARCLDSPQFYRHFVYLAVGFLCGRGARRSKLSESMQQVQQIGEETYRSSEGFQKPNTRFLWGIIGDVQQLGSATGLDLTTRKLLLTAR